MFEHRNVDPTKPKPDDFIKLANECQSLIDSLNNSTIDNAPSMQLKINKFDQLFNWVFDYHFKERENRESYRSESIEKHNHLVEFEKTSNSLRDSLKQLFTGTELNIATVTNKLETNPSLKNTLSDQLTQFKQIILYLDRILRGNYEHTFLYDYMSNVNSVNDVGLIKDLIINHKFGTDEFKIEEVKEKFPDMGMFKLGLIEKLDSLFKNAPTHQKMKDLFKNIARP